MNKFKSVNCFQVKQINQVSVDVYMQTMKTQIAQTQKVRAKDFTAAQTASLCDSIVSHFHNAKRQQQRKQRQSPINSSLFVLMWKLVQILELAKFDRRVLLTTPSHLQSLQSMISELFKGLFCQKAHSLFKKSDFFGKSWLNILSKDSSLRISEMKFNEIEQLLDKNIYGDLSSSRKASPSNRARSPNHPSFLLQDNINGVKDLYEVMIDLSVFIIMKLAGSSDHCDQQDSVIGPIDASGDFLNHIVAAFVKHVRQHETLSQRQKDQQVQGLTSSKKRKGGKNDVSKQDILTCLPSALLFLKLLQLSKRLQIVAKDKELASKLLGVLPQLFQVDEETEIPNLNGRRKALDLNQLIVSHGRQNYQTNNYQQPGTAGRPLATGPDGIATGYGGAITLESGRSNTLRGFQHSPNKQMSPNKNQHTGGDDKDRSFYRKKLDGRQMGNFRAKSEPPEEIGLIQMHSQEDLKASKELAGTFTKGDEQRLLQLNLNQAAIAQSATRNRNIQKVPPILVNKIQNMASQQQTAQNNFQSTNSSIVMNNFFNMPHGQLYQTSNTVQQSAHHPPSGADKTSQYKFVSQPTLAKSRLTRRQQSMTKTSVNNLSSNNLLTGKLASQPTNQSLNLTNLATAALANKRDSSAQPIQATNPYKDANEDTLGSKRSASTKPKVAVPALNFTKVLKQSGPDSRSNKAGGIPNSMSPFPGTAAAGGVTNSMLPSAVSTHKFLNAQQATSISNNAFIANNFLVPAVASRQSVHQQTRSSRSPVSTHYRNNTQQNIIQDKTVQGVRETESMFDDVNGSFALDQAQDANPLEFINAEEKLQNLAIQLGESCLTHDLAALMSQKRDLELVESARKIVQKRPKKIGRQWTQQQLGVQRSQSWQQQLSNELDQRPKKSDSAGSESLKKQKNNLVQRASEILNKDKLQGMQQQRIRYRVVLMNILENLLMAVNNEEARFLRQPVNLLSSYLESAYFRSQRDKKQIRELKRCIQMPNQSKQTIRLPIDLSQLTLLFGKTGFKEEIDDKEKFYMKNDGQTFKLAELNQCKIEGMVVPPYLDLSVESSYIHQDGQDVSQLRESSLSPKHSTRERVLSQKQSVLLEAQDLFKAICLPEVKIVTRLLCKFQFVNEDILRQQVMNELSSFTNRERAVESKLFASLLQTPHTFYQSQLNNQLNSSQLGLPIGGYNLSPSKQVMANSFELDQQEAMMVEQLGGQGLKSNKLLAHQTLNHSQCFWSTNGIAYEVFQSNNSTAISSVKQSSAALVSRESIRMKLDSVLYSVSRRIRYIFSQGYEMTDFEFTDAIAVQIVMLNAYLEEQKSRTILHQVIEVCLEPLLMVKKALIEISLNTNILVMDFTRNMTISDLIISAKGTSVDVAEDSDHMSLKTKLLIRQQRLKDLFSEFLQLCGILLKTPQSADTLKLFNETLIYDEMWQEGIKTFVIALFLSDLVGPVTAQDLNHYQRQQLEDLRGINIVNFDQYFYMNNIAQLREPKLYQQARESVNRNLLAAMKILKYLKAVAQFYDSAIQLYFPQTFDQQSKQKASQVQATHAGSNNLQPNIAGQAYSNVGYIPGMPSTAQMNKGKDQASGAGAADAQKAEAEKQRNQKYWKHVVRKVLYQLMFLITQPNGLFYQYLQNNATKYTNYEGQDSRRLSRSHKFSEEQDAYQQQATPINLSLTQSMLSFMRRIFSLPERFTKYVFDEELLLFYIRTNYISFVKLYNKNFSITQQVQDFQERSGANYARTTTAGLPSELASPTEQEQNQKHREVRKQASLTLCKKLLKCLFAIAKNRNEDTRRKLFQFKIVQFLLQEIGLEFEVQQRREKFIKLSKEQENNKTVDIDDPLKNSLTLDKHSSPEQSVKLKGDLAPKPPGNAPAGEALSTIADVERKTHDQNNDAEQDRSHEKMQSNNQQPAPRKKPFIPPLLGAKNLGMSTLQNEQGKTQEELDVEATVKQGQQQQQRIQAPLQQPAQAEAPLVMKEQLPVKKKPFIPPLLGAKNLGMSTLVQPNGKTQEEMDVDNLVKGNQPQPVKQETVVQQSELQSTQNEVQPAPVKKKPFIPPLLGAKNLGMSTLIQANGKTQEEMDVENQVNGNKSIANTNVQNSPVNQVNQPSQAPAPVKKKPFIPPLLGAKNLGMSTLIQENGKTQEEMDVDNLVKGRQPDQMPIQPQQNAIVEPVQQKQEQAFIVKKKPFIPPLLGAKNLGMSTLIQANGKTQEEMDVENQVKQNCNSYQGPRIASTQNVIEDKKGEESDQTDDSEVRRQYGIQSQQDLARNSPKPKQSENNNDGEGSSSDDSYYEELARIKAAQQAAEQQQIASGVPPLNAPNKRFVPKLAVKSLGFSTLTKEGQNKTQEELDVESQILQSRGAALTQPQLIKNHTVPDQQTSQGLPNPITNQFVQQDDSQTNQSSQMRQSMKILNQDEADASKRSKLRSQRKGLIRQSRSNLRRNVETEEVRSKPVSRIHAYQSEAALADSTVQSPQNVISGFHEHSQINTIMQTSIDQHPVFIGKDSEAMRLSKDAGMLSPPSQNEKNAERSRSNSSTGSHVGRNKTFIPHLSFPEDINVDPREKRKVYEKPKGEARFSLKKSSALNVGAIKKAYGKKSKLLEFQIGGGETASQLQDEPVADQPLHAARDNKVSLHEVPATIDVTNNQVIGNDSIKSNKIKKISFLKKSSIQEHSIASDKTPYDEPTSKVHLERMMSHGSTDRRGGWGHKDVTEEVFYMKERGVRPIYQDEELHVLMLSLMMCLLLKPERGTLDEFYCSQFPIQDDNQNILYLLHWHLSHPKNQNIVPSLLKMMEQISPPLAGIRLLKLMCPSLFDISLYNNGQGWKKLAAGQYGIVYECQTKFARPQSVAIKQMSLPQSISDRCVLHDIFTEITCLEEFRLEPCVTDLFDYGVDQTSYYIVMKKYTGSLREWRLRQKTNIMDNLSLYLSIYKEVLKAFKVIQSHNVTHYDIKCDNILIDFKGSSEMQAPVGPGKGRYDQHQFASPNQQQMAFEAQNISSDDFTITIGDFGTCHMYYSDKDEFLVSDRGTPNIKSPEMIELELNKRTDHDKHDRRKRVGTSRLSDVWSLGCLFYELLTGEMLFDADEYAWFFVRLTKTQLDLFEDGKLDKINNNVYLIDFLKYILVRDPRLRPTIDNVLKRFEHVYALLVATSSGHTRFNRLQPTESEVYSQRGNRLTLQQMLQRTAQIMMQNSASSSIKTPKALPLSYGDAEKQMHLEMPTLMRIMEDVFISSIVWLQTCPAKVIQAGITHIVIPEHLVDRQISDMFEVFAIPSHIEELPNPKEVSINPYSVMPGVMDFLRRAALFKGRVLFIESKLDWTAVSNAAVSCAPAVDNFQTTAVLQQRVHLVRECMLMCLAAIYQTSAYETYTLIKSQNLFFTVEAHRLQTISEWTQLCASIQQNLASYPKFSCMCGSCVVILKRQFATYQSTQLLACQCQHYYKNFGGDHNAVCPSPGCADFIAFLKTYYKQETEQLGLLPDNQLLWGFFEEEDFVVGPNFSGLTDNYQQRQIAASISKTIDKNSTLVATTDKGRNTNGIANAGGSNTPGGNTDLISRSSATRRNYSRQGGSALGLHQNAANFQRWKLYKCKHCQIWTYGFNEHESRYAILLNNRVKDQRLSRLGLLAGQDDIDLTNGQSDQAAVRVPILENIKLKIPF